jgi:hypothetical protein
MGLTTKFLFARLTSLATKFFLSDLREASLAMKFLSARLVRSDSRNEISVCETHEKRSRY